MSRKRGVGENAANGEAPVMPNSNAAKMRVVRQKIAHNPLSTTVIAVATPKKRSRSDFIEKTHIYYFLKIIFWRVLPDFIEKTRLALSPPA